ncbi:MAG: chemotaxis response regulator protein-glutamate methylesterase [Zoogloeaceae bacterium]|jgi:two-component system chemotaxis response regulator CheB|nr:chemotaxis response regulator protein-glutamate methylesterase [Zoogloeaceae bacterium]
MKIRVLVVDDSSFMRRQLTEIINADPDLEVVGDAADAEAAWKMIPELRPEVLTLDVNMPKTSGLEFLERLMRERPMRVVMVSSFTREGSEATLKALELGAIDFVAKPRVTSPQSLADYRRELAEKIRTARQARLFGRRASAAPLSRPAIDHARSPAPRISVRSSVSTGMAGRVIFLGASTGGTEAIKRFLRGMPADCPPILMVQHMPETFTPSFAALLDATSQPRVLEVQGGEIITPGTVYLAPGHSHMVICRNGADLRAELVQTPPVNHSRPSVDVLFESAAATMGRRAVGVILTGIGRDGAQGLLKMRQAGARTFGQDEASCVVYGMPREAFLAGAVEEVASIDQMACRVLSLFGRDAL